MVSMAKKAGCLVAGFSKVEAALKNQQVSVLLHATDAALDGVERLDRIMAARRNAEGLTSLTCRLFESVDLDRSLGSVNTKHVAIWDSGLSEGLKTRLVKLETFG